MKKKEARLISSGDDVENTVFKILMFNEHATETNEPTQALAKIHEYDDGRLNYFVLFDGFAIVDLYGENYSRKNKASWKFKKVSASCFNSYIKYLQTKKKVCYTNASRKVYDGT